MALKSGLAAQLGVVKETTWGVPATVTQFVPLVSESLTHEVERLESAGIIAGRQILTDDQWADGNIVASGDAQFELYTRSMGRLWEAAFGTVDTQAAAALYEHTFWVANERPSLTVQVGKPSVAGTVEPWTFTGMKVAEMDIAFSAGEIVTCGVSFAGKWAIRHRSVTDGVTTSGGSLVTSATASFSSDDVGKPLSGGSIVAGATITSVTDAATAVLSGTSTAAGTAVTLAIGVPLAAASYSSGLVPYTFRHGTATLDGSAVQVKSGNIKITNGLDVERRFLGQGHISEPLHNELTMVDGALTLEFTDETQYDTYVAGGTVPLALAFAGESDRAAYLNATVRYDGSTPQVAGREILEQEVPFKVVAGASDAAAVSGTIINADSAV